MTPPTAQEIESYRKILVLGRDYKEDDWPDERIASILTAEAEDGFVFLEFMRAWNYFLYPRTQHT